MVGPGEVDDELEVEVKEECAKYGDVVGAKVKWVLPGPRLELGTFCLAFDRLTGWAMSNFYRCTKFRALLKARPCEYLSNLPALIMQSKVNSENWLLSLRFEPALSGSMINVSPDCATSKHLARVAMNDRYFGGRTVKGRFYNLERYRQSKLEDNLMPF